MGLKSSRPRRRPSLAAGILHFFLLAGSAGLVPAQADFQDRLADGEALPEVPPGFEVRVFAREPLVRQPCSMAFDGRGRLFVGMGPQYRHPEPDTPGDSVVLVLDTDGDGTADRTRVFADGFNCVQGLAWRGRDLWVANAPDLTVVRDLDGDDEADEYVRIYRDLGNLEHGLHGLNWAPDGKLYLSKGNSKGLNLADRYAPGAFRGMWGLPSPPGALEVPPPQTFGKGDYRHDYHDPADDWGREGGVLRCDPGGANPELVARGLRNPWDMGFDNSFTWLGTDNDQSDGDRLFMPFRGAHFGWNHPWSAGWTGEGQPQCAPVSGPVFQGSGTGVVFGDSPQFPPAFRGVWFINDWLRKTTFVYRPQWAGALLQPAGGKWEEFVRGGKALFRPVDLEFGPDGALWCLGWSRGYGAEYKEGAMTSEGRIYRIAWKDAGPPVPHRREVADCPVDELLRAFNTTLPVWRVDAQNELVRRGAGVKPELLAVLGGGQLSMAQETWTAWALGRMDPKDEALEEFFGSLLTTDTAAGLNLRQQALRILAHRVRQFGVRKSLPARVAAVLHSPEPRLRLEAVQALAAAGAGEAVPAVVELLEVETDRVVFYAAWQALRELSGRADLKAGLAHRAGGVRCGSLLALLEDHALNRGEVQPLAEDPDSRVREAAVLWLGKTSGGVAEPVVRGRPLGTAPAGLPEAAPAGVVRNITARSGRSYQLAPGGLQAGALHFTDRALRLREVPAALQGIDLIRTANDDDGSSGGDFLTFEALLPVRVHVGIDTRARELPPWLQEGWTREAASIAADHWSYQLYSRGFPAGKVVLGGNTADGAMGGKSQYLVAVGTLPLVPPAQPAGMGEVLALLATADPARGAALFQQPGGAGCYACHQIHGFGNAFGPDLSEIGMTGDARHPVQSILEPNAVITEGFNLVVIETGGGTHAGVLLEESGLAVTLGLPDGQRAVISKEKIRSRQTAPVSAMPPYAAVLQAQQVADLAAWLLTLKAAGPDAAAGSRPGPAGKDVAALPSGDGLRFDLHGDRLVMTHSGQPVAQYVFRDDRIFRPYFANLHAPGGRPVTRHHPPVEGRDAADHADMHPGFWLGFGDINGEDFWRNKGRIEQERFTAPPVLQDGQLSFATMSRLVTAANRPLCSLTSRFTLTAAPQAWMISWDAEFHADQEDLVFGDQEEMGFGARVATALTEKGGGLILSSTGRRSAAATWGQPAAWCDYSGTPDGQPSGISLMPSPGNFRPCWWHNRDYGVFVANPFGRAAMKQGAPSKVRVPRGGSLRLRCTAVLHSGEGYDPAAAWQAVTGK